MPSFVQLRSNLLFHLFMYLIYNIYAILFIISLGKVSRVCPRACVGLKTV